MVPLTDDDKTQLGQLTDYLFIRRETIADQWQTKCARDEDLPLFSGSSRTDFTDQLLVLLYGLIQPVTAEAQAGDLVERVSQSELYGWPHGHFLTELLMELDNFYAVLDEQIQRFLELYPQTHSRVITQVYSQLLGLSKEVNKQHTVFPLQAAMDSLQELNRQRTDQLQQSAHDLRSSFSILSTAASLLQGPLKDDDQVKFMDMISRNVKTAAHQLDQLLVYARPNVSPARPAPDREASQSTPPTE